MMGAMSSAWGKLRIALGFTVALGACQARQQTASATPSPPSAVDVPDPHADDAAATPATDSPPAAAEPSEGLPPVPELPQRPLREGQAYTVWGASYSLRHPALTDSVRGQRIQVRGVVGRTNLLDAPKCAARPPGVAVPAGCVAPIPVLWLCDSADDAPVDCIRVMGWASTYSQIYKAIRSCAQDPPAPVLDDYWGQEISCPVPAAGAVVTVTGTYQTTFDGAPGGTAVDPIMGIITSQTIETHQPSPTPARLP